MLTGNEVCPTYVGMNRYHHDAGTVSPCMPHVCGDEPWERHKKRLEEAYAPRMWG